MAYERQLPPNPPDPPPPVDTTPTPRSTLENTSTPASDQQMSMAALDALLPIVYGTRPIPGLIANVLTNQSDWVFWVIWCEGEIDAITTITSNDEPLPASAVVTSYLGTSSQGVDSTLVAAFNVASPPISFNEPLHNVAYSVIVIPHVDITAAPRFAAVVNGRKVKVLEDAIQIDVNCTGDGSENAYAYHGIMNDAYLIAAGDVLRYEYYIAAAPDTTTAVGGFEIDLTGSPANVRSSTCVDNDGQNINNPLAKAEGIWIERWVDLDDVAGQTTANFNLVVENDAPGNYRVLYRNIRITNADGTVVNKVIWTSGALDQNASQYANEMTSTVTVPGGTIFSRNPSYQAADYITNTVFGAGLEVDWGSVARAAYFNSEYVGTVNFESSRMSDLYMDSESSCDNWIDTFRAVANIFFSNNQGVIKFIPDRGGSPVATYTHDDGEILNISDIEIASPQNLPTVIEIIYTDTSSLPWKDARQTFKRTGVDAGVTPWRFSSVPMRWITRAGQALREANERGNKLWLRSLKFNVEIFDEGFQHEPGDIIAIDYPDAGFDNLPVRISAVTPSKNGWVLSVSKEDPNAYDYDSEADPGIGNVSLPVPSSPPALGSVTAEEEIYQTQPGTWASRVRVSWTAPNFPFVDHYRIVVWNGGTQVFTGTAASGYTSWTTAALEELIDYQIDVQIVSVTGASGPISSIDLRPLGKYAPPSIVPSIRGFEAGGKVYLWWEAAEDLDIFRYELRYGTTTGTWDTATIVDRLDGLNKVAEGLPAGAWRFYIAALDSVGNYSGTVNTTSYPYVYTVVPTTIDLEVTLDSNAFLVNSFTFQSPTLVNVTNVVMKDGSHMYVTDFGENIGYGHTNTDNTLADFTLPTGIVDDPFNTPRTSGTDATYTTDVWDVGMTISGNVTFAPNLSIDNGTVTIYVDTTTDPNLGWTPHTGGSAKDTFRFIRGRVVSNITDGAFSITGYPTARVDAIARTETFSNLSTNAVIATTVTLANEYAKTKAITITPHGTAPRLYTVDNIVVGAGVTNSFDVWIFDLTGAAVTCVFDVTYEGI